MPIRCEQAVELFDAYLDGQLSSSLVAELDAHRLQCAECRRRLALLEVTEHLLTSDHEPVQLKADFTDRLIACMDSPSTLWTPRLRRWLYVAAPLAAAAVITLALFNYFDVRDRGLRAGVTVEVGEVDVLAVPDEGLLNPDDRTSDDAAIQAWYAQLRARLAEKRESVETFQRAFNLILPQPLDSLAPSDELALPGDADDIESEEQGEPPVDEDADDEEVEDL